MATIRIVGLRDKRDKSGTLPLYLQLSVRGTVRRISLGYRIPERHWNTRTGKARASFDASEEINDFLSEVSSQAQSALLKLKGSRYPVSAARLKRYVQAALEAEDHSQDDFFAYYKQQIKIYEQRRQIGTARRHSSALSRLRDFCQHRRIGPDLPFDAIAPAFVRAFDTYLVGKRGLKQSSSNNHIKAVRTIFYRALREGITEAKNPFLQITLKREDPAGLVALTIEELERLVNLPDLPDSDQEIVDAFAFATYALGMRVSDLLMLTWSNLEGGRLRYTMRKSGKRVNIKLPEKAAEIIEGYRDRGPGEYVWPTLANYDLRTEKQKFQVISARAAYYNKRLKDFAKMAGINKRLTMHVARHTFSRIALENGWSMRKLQNALCHSSIRTTERYAGQLLTEDLDDDVADLF